MLLAIISLLKQLCIQHKFIQKTAQKYYPYSKVKVSEIPVKLSPQKRTPYYKVKNKNQYLKASNIDGVIRQVCQNTFVYATN